MVFYNSLQIKQQGETKQHKLKAEPVSYTHLDVYKRQLLGVLLGMITLYRCPFPYQLLLLPPLGYLVLVITYFN